MTHTLATATIERPLRWLSAALGAAVAGIGGYFFVAWLSGAMTWRGHQVITMKTNSSLCLLVCGLSLLLTALPGAGSAARRLARAFAAISLVVGALTFLEIIFSSDFGIDQLIAKEPPGGLGILRPNRMGPPGAISFTLGGLSLLLLLHGSRRAVKTAQWLAAVICVIALLGMLGYLFGAEMLYGAARYTVIAWQTTVANFILSIGLLAARPAEGLMAPFTSANPGGAAIRRLIPYALILPVLLGWLRLQGEWYGLYERYFGTAILVLSLAISFVILVYRTGVGLGRSAEALQRTQSLLLEAEALSHTGAWEWDVASDIWTFSDEWLRIHGMERKNLPAAELLSIAHPEDREAVQGAFADLRCGVRPYDLEHRIVRQDTGRVRTVRARGQFIKDHAGGVVRAYGFIQDITEQKMAEEDLRKSEAKFRAVFELAAVGMGRVGFDDARWIDVNDAFCRMLGYTPEFMRATPWPDITHPEDVDLDLIPFRRMAAGELESYTVEKRFIHKDGHHVWARLTLSLVRDIEGRPDYEIAVIEDITERKLAEEELRQAKEELEVRVRERTKELAQTLQDLRVETAERFQAVEDLRRNEQMFLQQRRLAAMGEMLANISHQWRQPLNVLSLILQDLDRRYDKGTFSKEFLKSTVTRGRELISHMSQTIDDFRDYLKPERVKSSLDVMEVVEKGVAMVAETLKGIDLDIRQEGDGPVAAEGYPNEFAQVVMNILINARDAFRERGTAHPAVTIRVYRQNGRSVVTVADNAGGIPPDIMDKVFDPYFTTKEPDKGTGIGLFMSKMIIEKNMGGSLTVLNTAEGAEFRIEV